VIPTTHNETDLKYVQNSQIDCYECIPCDYNYMTVNEKLLCTRPLFLTNQFSMISATIKKFNHSSEGFWRIYDLNIWITLIFILLLLSIFTAFKLNVNKEKNLSHKFLYSFWVYFISIFREGNRRKPYILVYILWLISIIPIVEIYKNSLLANLVSIPDLLVDDIGDLLVENRKIYAFNELKIKTMKNISRADSLLKEKWIKIFEKLSFFDLSTSLKYSNSNEEFTELTKHSTYIVDEIASQVLFLILSRYFRVHIGKHSYFPKLTSYACFSPDFPYIQHANKM